MAAVLSHSSHRWSVNRHAVVHSHSQSSSSTNTAEIFTAPKVRTEAGLDKMALSSRSGSRVSLFTSLYMSSEEALSSADAGTGDSDSLDSFDDDDDWGSLYDLCPDEKDKVFRIVTINACPGRPRIVDVPVSPKRLASQLARQAQKNMSSVSLDSPFPSPRVADNKARWARTLMRHGDHLKEPLPITHTNIPRRSPYNLHLDTRAAASMAALPTLNNGPHTQSANYRIVGPTNFGTPRSASAASSTYSEQSNPPGSYSTSPEIDTESYTSVSTPDEYKDQGRRDTIWPGAPIIATNPTNMRTGPPMAVHMEEPMSAVSRSMSPVGSISATSFLDQDPYPHAVPESRRKLKRSRLRNIGHSISLGRSKSKREPRSTPEASPHEAPAIPTYAPPPIPPQSPARFDPRYADRRASITSISSLAARIAPSPGSASSSATLKPSRSVKRAAAIGREIAKQNAAANMGRAERRVPEVTIGQTKMKLVPRGADEREAPLVMPTWPREERR